MATIKGKAKADFLQGTGSDDAISGLGGNDELLGFGGNDELQGGAGADRMEGGTGDDTYYVDNAGDVIVESVNAGLDWVWSSVNYTLAAHVENINLQNEARTAWGNELNNRIHGNSASNVLYGYGGNDNLTGADGNDLIYAGTGNDSFEGGSGDDTLYGEAGDDFLFGRLDNDRLEGGDGNDFLQGHAGDDRLDGGLGIDILVGDSGADIFAFSTARSAADVDLIHHFDANNDALEFSLAAFGGFVVTGRLAATAFHVGTEAQTAAHRLIYDSASGTLYYDADGTGEGVQMHIAVMGSIVGSFDAGDVRIA